MKQILAWDGTTVETSPPEYPSGTVRAMRYLGSADIRCYRPEEGWTAFIDVFDDHPITREPFDDDDIGWWIVETKE